eukprot:2611244-Prymnesium_polylepis.2
MCVPPVPTCATTALLAAFDAGPPAVAGAGADAAALSCSISGAGAAAAASVPDLCAPEAAALLAAGAAGMSLTSANSDLSLHPIRSCWASSLSAGRWP